MSNIPHQIARILLPSNQLKQMHETMHMWTATPKAYRYPGAELPGCTGCCRDSMLQHEHETEMRCVIRV